MKVQVKICGIQSVEDAKVAIGNGADFIGLNFVPTSKRRIAVKLAKKIVETSRKDVQVVGIFQNQSITEVNNISSELNFDYIQLHGLESPEYCAQISTKIIKAFSLEENFDADKLLASTKKYRVEHFLFDRKIQGEGLPLNPKSMITIAGKYSVFIAGGLNSENIIETINMVKPFAVDVASGVETDGKIDKNKVNKFLQQAKSINY